MFWSYECNADRPRRGITTMMSWTSESSIESKIDRSKRAQGKRKREARRTQTSTGVTSRARNETATWIRATVEDVWTSKGNDAVLQRHFNRISQHIHIARSTSFEMPPECIHEDISRFRSPLHKGRTLFMQAARKGDVRTLRRLLKYFGTLNIDEQSDDLFTALHYAAYYGHGECVQTLLEYGARTDMLNKYDETPSETARAAGFPTIAYQIESDALVSSSIAQQSRTLEPPGTSEHRLLVGSVASLRTHVDVRTLNKRFRSCRQRLVREMCEVDTAGIIRRRAHMMSDSMTRRRRRHENWESIRHRWHEQFDAMKLPSSDGETNRGPVVARSFSINPAFAQHLRRSETAREANERLRRQLLGKRPSSRSSSSSRDRAAERRRDQQNGAHIAHVDMSLAQQAYRAPLEAERKRHEKLPASNVGHRLLKKMGWAEGDGLGKSKRGNCESLSLTRDRERVRNTAKEMLRALQDDMDVPTRSRLSLSACKQRRPKLYDDIMRRATRRAVVAPSSSSSAARRRGLGWNV